MTTAKRATNRKDRDRMFLVTVVVIAMLALLTVMSTRIARIYRSESPVVDLNVTPIMNQPGRGGWKTFTHAEHRFTFKYPESWYVSLTKTNVRDRGYNLLLTYKKDSREHRVEFLRGGRGAPLNDSIKRDTLDYGGHTGYKNIYIKRTIPFKEVITFRDPSVIAPYIAIDAELPRSNPAEYEHIIDTIASSIKKVK